MKVYVGLAGEGVNGNKVLPGSSSFTGSHKSLIKKSYQRACEKNLRPLTSSSLISTKEKEVKVLSAGLFSFLLSFFSGSPAVKGVARVFLLSWARGVGKVVEQMSD